MATSRTRPFDDQIRALGEDPADWAIYFQEWTELSDQYDDEFFGKDSAYVRPAVGGRPYVLRHVHLKPFEPTALKKWESEHWLRTRKSSNRVLVYASDGKGNHLLIFILNEPDAHAIANMKTAEDRATMESFAAVAEAFIFNGQDITR
ncbi:type II toxin-antitoxin system YafO family toxin [Variovorax sp. CAN2819]|uniref:type II toxin-antitoxin system YafO family toxin n=1 Tax=Variovorax sp. CAN15 TaxID=3046727 RepID=UPI002648BF5A|nr:type II toxin-antitoxin system YafO family toxin [Variovorax sp. CAN15]MDN6887854.1 type II toxin-antitoxin system YafO family toxin [Variovorax sp. CAN15]